MEDKIKGLLDLYNDVLIAGGFEVDNIEDAWNGLMFEDIDPADLQHPKKTPYNILGKKGRKYLTVSAPLRQDGEVAIVAFDERGNEELIENEDDLIQFLIRLKMV